MADAPIFDYIVTPHAMVEMERRRIDRETVQQVLNVPEQRLPVRKGRDVFQSRIVFENKTYLVRIFVDIDRHPAEVVTVYRTSKIAKYWRKQP